MMHLYWRAHFQWMMGIGSASCKKSKAALGFLMTCSYCHSRRVVQKSASSVYKSQTQIVVLFSLPLLTAAVPVQPCGAAGISVRPRAEPPAGSQLCQRPPAAQRRPDALAQL